LPPGLAGEEDVAAGAAVVAAAASAPAAPAAVGVAAAAAGLAAAVDSAAADLAAALLLPLQLPRRPLLTRLWWQDSRHSAPQDNNHEKLFPQFTFRSSRPVSVEPAR
jgi:hypothetical protein